MSSRIKVCSIEMVMKYTGTWSDTPLCLFLIVLPFAYWIEELNPFIWYLLITVTLYSLAIKVLIRKKAVYKKRVILLVGISILTIALYFIKFLWDGNPNNLYYTRFFLTTFAFIIIFGLYGLQSNTMLYKLIKYLLIINSAVLLFEALFVNFNLVSLDISPAYHDSPSYQPAEGQYKRPFGLTGNPSVNGIISLYLLFLYQYFAHVEGKKNLLGINILSLLGIVASGSGQAYLFGTITGFMYLLWQRRRSYYITVLVMFGVFVWVVISGVVRKISLDYLLSIYDLFIEKQFPFIFSRLDFSTFLFGRPSPDWPIDFFPLFVVGNYGFLFFTLYWIVILMGFLAYRNKFITLAAIVLFLGTLHYPAGFYFQTQVMTALVVVSGASQKSNAGNAFKTMGPEITQSATTPE